MIRAAACAAAVAAGLCWAAPPARAHPFAVSHFEATTQGDREAVGIAFHLDGISVSDLVDRYAGGDLGEDISRHRATILGYLDERFAVEADGRPCPRAQGARLWRERDGRRVHVTAVYRCERRIAELAMTSTLFLDEDTPHRVIGTLRHGRALERYLFGRSERTARAALDDLRQAGHAASGDGRFRTATPPPGAFTRSATRSASGATEPDDDGAREVGSGFVAFVRLGFAHIFAGLDHVLFVVCLVLGVRRFRELVAVVTAFTVAHSVTLVLGGLGLVTVSPLLVEPLIAASIVYAALEVAARERPRHRWSAVFAFGLMHGFGFSGALDGLGLGAGEALPMLLGLNVGVELGQLAIVAPLFPLVVLLQRAPRPYRWARAVAGAAVAAVALVWLVQRIAAW